MKTETLIEKYARLVEEKGELRTALQMSIGGVKALLALSGRDQEDLNEMEFAKLIPHL